MNDVYLNEEIKKKGIWENKIRREIRDESSSSFAKWYHFRMWQMLRSSRLRINQKIGGHAFCKQCL